ncbi:MAG: helix-turn-helix domain-containing protein [Chloroflexota bacterium]
MTNRTRAMDDALRHWHRQRLALADDLRTARRLTGVAQAAVAAAVGVSGAEISRRERGRSDPRLGQLVTHAAAVGLRLSVTAHPIGSGIRDAAQLRYVARFLERVSPTFRRELEAVIPLPGDLRAVDLVLRAPGVVVAVEVITRLADVQAQVRAARLKARDIGATRLLLAIAATRANRRALDGVRASLVTAFELDTRRTMTSLGRGQQPDRDAIILI